MKRSLTVLAVIVLLGFIGGYFYFKNQKLMNPTPAPISETRTKTLSGVKEIKIIAKSWAFDPAEIRVKKGETIRLKITSIDVEHGFLLPDFNINQKLEPGKEVSIEFLVDKKGTFMFICSVFCGAGHRDMKGYFIVE